jgi:hypothetical protein
LPRHTTGAQNTVAILLSAATMADTGPDNPASIAGVMRRFRDTDQLLRKFSYGKAWLDPVRVLGVYAGTIPGCVSPYNPGNPDAIVRYAISRADPDVDYRSVDRILIMLAPDLWGSCYTNPNGGFYPELDSEEGPFSAGVTMHEGIDFAFDGGTIDRVDIHEIVHTFGTGEVGFLSCYTTPAHTEPVPYSYTLGVPNGIPLGDVCPADFSQLELMGAYYYQAWGNITGSLKKQFGWLGPENVVTTRAGTYTLRPLDASTSASGTLMIRIPIPYTMNSYNLEQRVEAPEPGVYLYLATASRPPQEHVHQLWTAPYGIPGSGPHPLQLGTTTIDAAMDLIVDVISSDSGGATLTITSDPTYVTQCSDGVINGNNYLGTVWDQDDYSCQNGDGLSELEPAPACFNGLDDDGDGRTDEQDPGCLVDGVLQRQDDSE